MFQMLRMQKSKELFVGRDSPNSSFRDVLLLVGGTTIAQCINILIAPVLSRLYLPPDFATLAIYTSILGILCGFSNLAYHIAIPLPEDDDVSKHLLFLCIFLQSVMSFFLLLATVILSFDFFDRWGWGALYRFRIFVPLGFWGAGVYTAVSNYVLRQREYKALSRTRVIQKLLGAAVSVVGGLFELKSLALILGQLLSLSAGTLQLLKPFVNKKDIFSISFSKIIKVMRRYKNFPLYQNWGNVIDTLNGHLPSLLLVAFYSSEIVGLYAFSMRILQLPLSFVGSAIGQVFFQRGSVAFREERLGELAEQYVFFLFSLATFPFLFFSIVAPDFFGFLFGDIWREAGTIASFLCFFLWAQFISSTISSVLYITERLALSVAIPAGLLFITLIVFALCGKAPPSVFFTAYSIGRGIVYLFYLFIVIRIAGASLKKVGLGLLKEVVFALTLAFPMFFLVGGNLILLITISVFVVIIWSIRFVKTLRLLRN